MIFEFDSDGFLTDRSGTLETGIKRAHDGLFARARKINRDCHELLFATDVRNRDPQAILVATLFMRALEHYQATLILLGRGVVAPAKVVFRAALESVFTIRAVACDKGALETYVNSDLRQRLKLIKKARQHDYTNLEELRKALSDGGDNIVNYLNEHINSSGVKEVKIEELSKLAGMHEWYTSVYYMLSKAAHTTVRDLEVYLSLNKAGDIQSIEYGPSTEEIPHLVLNAAHCILFAAAAVAGTFEIDFQSTIIGHLNFIETEMKALNEAYSA